MLGFLHHDVRTEGLGFDSEHHEEPLKGSEHRNDRISSQF